MKKFTNKIGFLARIKENSVDLTGKQVEIADYIIPRIVEILIS